MQQKTYFTQALAKSDPEIGKALFDEAKRQQNQIELIASENIVSQAVLDALEWLATTYYRSRTGEISVPKLDDSIYELCRWRYVSNQSDVTMGQYESSYKTIVDGQAYRLEEHIGRGSSKDPVNTIRVAFHWDRERRRVIVGYIGQHQQTDAT